MSGDILVSIVIPVYNVERYIDECLESVTGQTYENTEIILVNDASSDDSGKKCDSWAGKDKRIKVIHKQANEGLFRARITGFEKMRGEYFMAVDSDDYIASDFVQKSIETADHSQADIIIAGQMKTVDSDGLHESSLTLPKLYTSSDVLDNFMKNVAKKMWGWNVCGKMYKTSIYRKASKYLSLIDRDINAGEDTLFSVVFAHFSTKAIYINKYAGYFYRQNDNSITRDISNDSFIRKLDSITGVLFEIENFMKTIKMYDKYRLEITFLKNWQLGDYLWVIRNEYIKQNTILEKRIAELEQYSVRLEGENAKILNSKTYRVGRFIATPYGKLRKMLK